MNKYLYYFLVLFYLLSYAVYAALPDTAVETYPFSSTATAKRFHALTEEIRCVVCQNQSIADSSAPLARDLRAKIYTMVLANQSDEEIKLYFVKRYGDFILFNPRFTPATFVLWLFPFIGIILLFCAILYKLISNKICYDHLNDQGNNHGT